ncbi:hypothetical protein [Saccharopolyspora pogona]|uniref:hypothetical protein n=1 Tax=Saccharopolyspora pogona TaxID=333966 RepID=UPI0016829373|nr:hypothetical protein [Saccharopolyspora pogona]
MTAGRPQASLERAFADTRPQPPRPNARKTDKAALLLTLRGEAIDRGLPIRSIADRHGVGQRTVLQALESPVPRPGKQYPSRRSRLEPFHDTIDEILRQEAGTPRRSRRTVRSILWTSLSTGTA